MTLNLKSGKHYPYLKPGNKPVYVHAMSSHPPCVIKAIPTGINNRLSAISSDEEVFNKAIPVYQKALDDSGHSYKLKFNPPKPNSKSNRKRSRNITWYNPPYDLRVETNIGRQFLKTLDESFPVGHVLRPLFNRNTVKLSYSCMPNISRVIDAHNKSEIEKSKPSTEDVKSCNCRIKNDCPLDGKCRERGIVYQATVIAEGKRHETYIGLTDTEFKMRYANHKQSFSKESLKNATELSKHIWTLKDQNVSYKLKWKIMGKAKSYSNVSKRCNLCLLEKYFIICHRDQATLNSRSELVSSCRHSAKFLLKNWHLGT